MSFCDCHMHDIWDIQTSRAMRIVDVLDGHACTFIVLPPDETGVRNVHVVTAVLALSVTAQDNIRNMPGVRYIKRLSD